MVRGTLQNVCMKEQLPRNISAEDLKSWLLKDPLKPILIDVREDQELRIAAFPSEVVHLPLSQSDLWIKTLPTILSGNSSVVVICHSGIRSMNFATWLIQQGLADDVWNLEGGIDAWSVSIDSTIPRY